MHDNFIVHHNYLHSAEKLRNVLTNFSEVGENVTQGERNSIKKVAIDGIVVNIKKFREPNFLQSLVYQFLRKSKAKRSFEYALKLIGFGINTPFPIAYFENFSFGLKQSFYVSEHVNYDFDFRELIHNPKFQNREEILRQFTQFTFKLHENNVNFLDHSPGNTLILETVKNKFDFYLIDLNRMRFEPMDFKKRMCNFRRLWLSKTMLKIMAKEYAELYGKTYSETHELMSFYSRKFQKAKNGKKLRRRKKL